MAKSLTCAIWCRRLVSVVSARTAAGKRVSMRVSSVVTVWMDQWLGEYDICTLSTLRLLLCDQTIKNPLTGYCQRALLPPPRRVRVNHLRCERGMHAALQKFTRISSDYPRLMRIFTAARFCTSVKNILKTCCCVIQSIVSCVTDILIAFYIIEWNYWTNCAQSGPPGVQQRGDRREPRRRWRQRSGVPGR